MRPGEKGTLKVLHSFFRIAAPVFLGLSMLFTLDSNGIFWVMWRDNTLLAVTLAFIGLLMGAGWWATALRQRDGRPIFRNEETSQVYNIFKRIDPSVRRRLALAVFLIFATIGPLSILMESPLHPVHPLRVLIVTLTSGGMSASIILFGNRRFLLAGAFLACLATNIYSDRLVWNLTGVQPPIATEGSTTLSIEQQSDLRSQRAVIGMIGVGLIASGYTMFLVVLNREGNKRVRLQAEVAIARRIQKSLLPDALVSTSWCAAAGRTVPATEVGGDYFDMVELSDGRLAVAIADVTGHGVGAGILSAMTKSALRSQLGHDASPHNVLENLNRTLYQVGQRNLFVTMGYIVLDRQAGIARVATAGHPPILVRRRDGAIQGLRTLNPGLGMRPQGSFSEEEVRFVPGDRFLLYTDGVTETTNAAGEQFGEGRLEDLFAADQPVSVDQLCSLVLETVLQFRGSQSLADDATVVAVGITG
jgi:hypothetical protein